mmetsp:Transcript_4373/g.8482  ORF Transcript_4373/g.8482 Transcript_4373/m.8482 type:complete len:342 (+) Transcript_4373:3671-4696(+)
MGNVVVRGNASQGGGLERPAAPIIAHQGALLQDTGGRVHQVQAAATEKGVCPEGLVGDAVEGRVAEHPHVEEGVANPLHGLLDGLHSPQDDLGVEVVGQGLDQLALDGKLEVHEAQIILQLGVGRDDDTLPLGVVLGAASPSEHLHNIQGAKLLPASLLRIIDLSPLNNDRVRGQVDTPRQGGRTDEHPHVMVRKEILHEFAVAAGHASVMGGKSVGQDVAKVIRLDIGQLLLEDLSSGGVSAHKEPRLIFIHSHVPQRLGSLGALRPGVHEDEYLVGHFLLLNNLLVAHLVLDAESLQRPLLGDSDVLLLKRHRSVAVVEEEEPLVRVYAQEGGHVPVVG